MVAGVPHAHAYINPRFTPVHLVSKSSLIASVEVKPGGTKDQYTITIKELLHGKEEHRSFVLDLSLALNEDSAKDFRALAASSPSALFFVGEYGNENAEPVRSGVLHMSGKFAACVFDQGSWKYETINASFLEIWNGGTDMLRRAVDYILCAQRDADDDPVIPAMEGIEWALPPLKSAVRSGTITTLRPVVLAGDGKQTLFVACDKGDLLLAGGADRTVTNIAAARGLRSASAAFAWGNFAGQGRLDLVSYDGKAVTLHAQQSDGKFQATPLNLGKTLEGGCTSLEALNSGSGNRAALLVNGSGLPVVVSWDEKGAPTVTPLTAPGIDLAKFGKAGAALVADFTGDACADILALRENGSILFCGEATGKFKPGTLSAPRCGNAGTRVTVGDFDSDGILDLLVFGGTTRLLWVNNGKGEFTERFNAVGEMMTHDQAATGSDCMATDINNDGRPDILVAYGNAAPVTYFARGFLSFGHSHKIDISENKLLPDANHAKDGQQAACYADLDGDGAQDLTLALKNGEVWTFFQNREARMAVATLSTAAQGPVTVTGWIGKRCLGAWNVAPGQVGLFGCQDAGAMTLKWRLPGGKEQTQEVVLENAGTRKVEIK
jgi:hypothetical protein